jgi:vacuolar-type H+-ATPase subunit C/Vma6
MKDLSTYAFINAKVRAMRGQCLSAEHFNRLIQARDIEDAIAVFKDTPYATLVRIDVLREKGLEFIEKELESYDISLHQKIMRGSADGCLKRIVALLRERYELDQIKVLLRIWNEKAGDEARPMAARNVDELAGTFANTPFAKPILAGKEKYQKTGSLFYIEAALDRDYFDRLWRQIDRLPRQDREIAKRMVAIEIDIENISGLIRLKQYYDLPFDEVASIMLPRGYKTNEQLLRGIFFKEVGGTTSRGLAMGPYHDLAELLGKGMDRSQLRLMEGVLTQVLFQEAQRALAGFPFTIGTILGYLILKRMETRNIISILYSKSYGMKPDQIRGILIC